jgi:uncharacterized protein Yka (UPF0111/DUF47 family)
MTDTVTSEFKVKDIVGSEVLLKEMNEGFVVFVQREKYRYSSEMWEDILDLSQGDVKTMTLEGQNQMNTIWEIAEISEKVPA